jgi:methionyl-tRNA formyltransferase
VDTGPILLKKRISPEPNATFDEIRAELETIMVELMIEGVRVLRDGSLVSIPQLLTEGRQYFIMHPRVKIKAKERLLKQITK